MKSNMTFTSLPIDNKCSNLDTIKNWNLYLEWHKTKLVGFFFKSYLFLKFMDQCYRINAHFACSAMQQT